MMNTLNGPFAVSISYTSSLDSHYWGASKITRTMPGFDLNELPETSPANVELLQWAEKRVTNHRKIGTRTTTILSSQSNKAIV